MSEIDLFLKLKRAGQMVVGSGTELGFEKQIPITSLDWDYAFSGTGRRQGEESVSKSELDRMSDQHLGALRSIASSLKEAKKDIAKQIFKPNIKREDVHEFISSKFEVLEEMVNDEASEFHDEVLDLSEVLDGELNPPDEAEESRSEEPEGVGTIGITKYSDRSSPVLIQSVAQGFIFDEALITAGYRIGTAGTSGSRVNVRYQIKLSGARLSSYRFTADDSMSSLHMKENLELTFSKIQIIFPKVEASTTGSGVKMAGVETFTFDIDEKPPV
jgi:type VI protein secretion system component Hcp